MKINIQNLEHNVLEHEGTVETDFLEPELRRYYPYRLNVCVKLDRFGNDYKIDVSIQTRAHYICDRCLKEYEPEFTAQISQVYETDSDQPVSDDDIKILPANAVEIDISPLLHEAIVLNHPIKMVCIEECKGICPGCGADLNVDICTCSAGNIDPRWAELKKIIK